VYPPLDFQNASITIKGIIRFFLWETNEGSKDYQMVREFMDNSKQKKKKIPFEFWYIGHKSHDFARHFVSKTPQTCIKPTQEIFLSLFMACSVCKKDLMCTQTQHHSFAHQTHYLCLCMYNKKGWNPLPGNIVQDVLPSPCDTLKLPKGWIFAAPHLSH
jgi:hypothetical protein